MTTTPTNRNPLYEMEAEVLEEGREWMRQRLEKKLQRQAEAQARLSPPERTSPAEHPLPDDAHSQHGR